MYMACARAGKECHIALVPEEMVIRLNLSSAYHSHYLLSTLNHCHLRSKGFRSILRRRKLACNA
jgi:hypothetical protein